MQSIVTPNEHHEDVAMRTVKSTLLNLLVKFHPSFFMAYFMLIAAGAMEISYQLQIAGVANLATVSMSRTAQNILPDAQFTVTYTFIKWMLLIFALIILRSKPSHGWTYALSSPLIIYGYYAFRYLVEAGLPDLSIPVLMAGGYISVALLTGVSSLLTESVHERNECVSAYELLIKEYERTIAELKSHQEGNHATGIEPTANV